MKINHQFLLVQIDKAAQTAKRSQIQLSERTYLGLSGKYQKAENNQPAGIVVVKAADGSPAYEAGFKSGDIVIGVDNRTLNSFEELTEYVWKKKAGDKITIELYNALSITDRISYKQVTLSAKPPSVGGISISNQFTDMLYNLQYGIIHQVGKLAKKEFPMAEPGDLLLFNHKVEYKPKSEGDKLYHDYHLVETLPDGDELRIVDYSYECYGVIKINNGDHTIYPYKNIIFCHQNIRNASIMMKNGLYLPDAWEKTQEEVADELEGLQLEITKLSTQTVMTAQTNEHNYRKKEEIIEAINEKNKQRALLTKQIHAKRLKELTVLFINPETCKQLGADIKAGDTIVANYHTLYPLDFGGACYTLAFPEHVEALIKK